MSDRATYLPALPSVDVIARRLGVIFPEGSPFRSQATGDRAAKTAFVMLYIGAVEGSQRWIRPDQVTRMTDLQAARCDEASRLAWAADSLKSLRGRQIAGRWYEVNSREGIRDDTLRNAWLPAGAVIKRPDLPTTSARPAWALESSFARLLTWRVRPDIDEQALVKAEQTAQYLDAVKQWQSAHLSRESLSRVALVRHLNAAADAVTAHIPSRGPRHLAAGRSSAIAKAVIEVFAVRIMDKPAVIWLSESGNQSPLEDAGLASAIGLDISDSGILPDIIMADLGPPKPILVFVEIVATDGPMTESRRAAIYRLTDHAGYSRSSVALMTAFMDRDTPEYRKASSTTAWGTFVWIASEPDNLVLNLDTPLRGKRLAELLGLTSS